MPLDSTIISHLGDRALVTAFIVELLTSTPRRWTNYRGYASNGQRGLNYGVRVTGASVTAGGTGYTSATVSVSGGGGQGAAFTAVMSGGVITGLTMTNAGYGYTSAPAIAISGNGTGATASATTAVNFYSTFDVVIPGIAEDEGVGPIDVEIVIGNAKNLATDLESDSSNIRKRALIKKLWIFDATLTETIPPSVVREQAWFDGVIGAPRFEGEYVYLQLHGDTGRRGASPRTESGSLMTSHTPPAKGSKIVIKIGT